MNDLITRFIVAVEAIGNALTTIANSNTLDAGVPAPAATPAAPAAAAAAAAAEKPARTRKAADPKPVDPAPAAAPEPAKAAAPEPAKAAAPEPAKPAFEYETLKKAIVELANAGTEGKEAALRILTDAGLERGQKANEAPAAKWPGMHAQAVEALAKINDPSNLA